MVREWVSQWRTYEADAVLHEVESWIAQDDVTGQLPQIAMPTLLLHGEEDDAIPLGEAEETARLIPQAELVRVPGAGHTLTLEAPRIVTEEIRRFGWRLT
jgi:pimeloyl-ACP methyl ester carboxylesterase